MRLPLPKLNNLYGRIFAIFWFTMLLVLFAVLTLPHLDPRKSRDLSPETHQRLLESRDRFEQQFRNQSDLRAILFQLEGPDSQHRKHDGQPRFFYHRFGKQHYHQLKADRFSF